jgi:hypothetical protein
MRLQDSNDIQQLFSSEQQPTLWRALPALEELQTAWEDKKKLERFALYEDAIDAGLSKLQKYYSRIDTKPVFVLALGAFLYFSEYSLSMSLIIVLHPYYKLDYIKLSWGGAEEQEMERLEGNLNAKNWQDEARKVVENTVSVNSWSCSPAHTKRWIDGHVLQKASESRACTTTRHPT